MRMAFLSRGFKNLQWYGMTSEHHPCFELFYRNTGSYISRNTKIAKMFLYASIAV